MQKDNPQARSADLSFPDTPDIWAVYFKTSAGERMWRQGGAAMANDPLPTFSVAAATWFADRKRHLRPSTADSYADALKPLCKFLGDKPIDEIESSHIRFYQQLRKARVGAHAINRELGVLQQVMRKFGEWTRLAKDYEQLKEPAPHLDQRSNPEQERRFQEVAFSRPEWHLAGHCKVVMRSTGIGFEDLRQLRRRDINMKRRFFTIREGAKDKFRTRTVPLNEAAYQSMAWILKRWKKLGGRNPQHYILPSLSRGKRAHAPMLTIFSALRCIRTEAELQYSRRPEENSSAMLLSDEAPLGTVGKLICFPVTGGVA